jgi:hypothetical protein
MINTTLEENIKWIIETETNRIIENVNTPQIGGPLRYTEIIPAIDELREILRQIDFGGLRTLPKFRIEQLERFLKPIIRQINLIQETDRKPDQTDLDQKSQTVRFFSLNPSDDGHYLKSRQEIWQIINETITSKVHNFSASLNIDEKINSIYEIKTKADESLQTIRNIVSAAQQELGKSGVERHASIFHDQSEKHKKNSRKWLITAGIIIGLTIICLIVFFFVLLNNSSLIEKIEIGILSITVISILSYTIVIAIRNYFAEKHNELVNKHKANCLDSYSTFAESANEEIRSAVLLHATHTIFSHQSPGFLSKEVNQSPTPIMEIIRGFSKATESK